MKLIVHKQLIVILHSLPHQCFDKLFNIKWIKWVLIIERTLAKNPKQQKSIQKICIFQLIKKTSFLKCFVTFDTHCFVLFIIQPQFLYLASAISFRLNSNIICTIAFFSVIRPLIYLYLFVHGLKLSFNFKICFLYAFC